MSWHFSKKLLKDFENSRFSRALEAEYSAASCSDGEPSARSKSTTTAVESSCSGKTTESLSHSPSGTTCEPSTGSHGEELLTWFLRDFRAKETRQSEIFTAPTISTVGQIPFASLAQSGHGLRFWRTFQELFSTSEELQVTWPKSGMTLGGTAFHVSTRATKRRKSGKGGLVWRRPAATDWKRRNLDWPSVRKLGNPLCLPQQIAQRGFHGYLNPQFPAWLMGWPDTWAKFQPLETAKFQQWLDSHGRPSPELPIDHEARR